MVDGPFFPFPCIKWAKDAMADDWICSRIRGEEAQASAFRFTEEYNKQFRIVKSSVSM
jgi:hypothetical protein